MMHDSPSIKCAEAQPVPRSVLFPCFEQISSQISHHINSSSTHLHTFVASGFVSLASSEPPHTFSHLVCASPPLFADLVQICIAWDIHRNLCKGYLHWFDTISIHSTNWHYRISLHHSTKVVLIGLELLRNTFHHFSRLLMCNVHAYHTPVCLSLLCIDRIYRVQDPRQCFLAFTDAPFR